MRLMPEVFERVTPEGDGTWTTWSPRPGLRPHFSVGPEGLAISDHGRAPCCGCWERPLPPLEKGTRYRVAVEFKAENVPSPGTRVTALLVNKKGGHRAVPREYLLQKSGESEGWTQLELVFTADGSDPLALCLYYAWGEGGGRVVWRNAVLEPAVDLAANGASPRTRRASPATLRVAAVAGETPMDAPVEEKIDYWTGLVRRAASFGAQLVCLPERINRGPKLYTGGPVGESIAYDRFVEALGQTASECRIYVCAGLHQDEGDVVYNVAALFSDTGELIGAYRKTHPTIQESLFGGIRPGNDYTVFETPIGNIAAMVCYDYHFPEVARILGLKGADVICLPNAGDGRESGRYWETVLRTRAIDNQVHVVSGVNSGRASIVSPSGALLASTGKNFPGVAVAEIDLREAMVSWDGRPLKGIYDKIRRSDTFAPLTRHIWER